ncbi:MAG: carboxymuconolactone decarboxylase family protein [Pseudomonadota bacterium]
MTEREQLRQKGTEIRRKLGLPDDIGAELLPGMPHLVDEVIFGRVWARPGLELEDRMLATLSALTSKQYLPQVGFYVRGALNIGMQPRLIQEVMLHCAMYSGVPTALNSLNVVKGVFNERGIPQPEEDLQEHDLDDLMKLGDDTMRDLHRERAEGGYAAPDSAASTLYVNAIQYLYGEIWNRPGITRRQRMVCSVAAFTATQMPGQQRKFFQSAPNVGVTRDEVIEIIIQTGPYSGFPPALNALTVAEEVLD